MPEEAVPHGSQSPFVGAERQWVRDELVRYFEELSSGEREGVVWVSLEGESGVGKTRIVQEMYERIAAHQSVYPKTLRPAGPEALARKSVAHTREAGGEGLGKGEGVASFSWVGVDCDLHTSRSVGTSGLASAVAELRHVFPSRISGKVRPLAAMGEEGLGELADLFTAHAVEQLDNLGWVVEQTVGQVLVPAKIAVAGLRGLVKRRRALKKETGEQFIDPDLASVDELLGAFSELRGELLGANRRPVPVVMYIEDLHDANEPIAQLVLLLASLSVARGVAQKVKRRLRRQPSFPPVLLITSGWPSAIRELAGAVETDAAAEEASAGGAPLAASVAATLRAAPSGEHALSPDTLLVRRQLERLATHDLAELVHAYAHQLTGLPAPSDVAEAVAAHCEGNPLLLHLICEDRVEWEVPLGDWLDDLPADLWEAFRERWERLDGDVQGILALAAAVGREFHDELVTLCAEDLKRKVRVRDAHSALSGAERRAFVRREPAGGQVCRFFERECYDLALAASKRMDLAEPVASVLARHAISIRDRHRRKWADGHSPLDLPHASEAPALRAVLEAHVQSAPVTTAQLFEAAVSAQLLTALRRDIDAHGEWRAVLRYQRLVEDHDGTTTEALTWHDPTEGRWAHNWASFAPEWSSPGFVDT